MCDQNAILVPGPYTTAQGFTTWLAEIATFQFWLPSSRSGPNSSTIIFLAVLGARGQKNRLLLLLIPRQKVYCNTENRKKSAWPSISLYKEKILHAWTILYMQQCNSQSCHGGVDKRSVRIHVPCQDSERSLIAFSFARLQWEVNISWLSHSIWLNVWNMLFLFD